MDDLDRIVEKYKHNFQLKSKQVEAFNYLKDGKGDLLVSLPVGYGKSLIYHLLPQVLGSNTDNPVVLVVSPLNIIHKDQLEDLRKHSISACRLNVCTKVVATTDSEEEIMDIEADVSLEHVKLGKYSVVLCHPEALFNTAKGQGLLSDERFNSRVVAVVIDECHIIEKWGDKFRTAFKKLGTIKAFFPNVPVVALSGTLTVEQKRAIPKQLCLENFAVIESSPDRPNIFLEKNKKESCEDVRGEYENIVVQVCDEFLEKMESTPVTLMFIPVFYMSEALCYLNSLFGIHNIYQSLYSAICSGQDEDVITTTIQELGKENPRIRLILTTSIAGMGFDPENVTRVIHTCPPRNVAQYLQEVGRSGRRGQSAKATLYYNNRDIAKNLPGISEDIINYCRNVSSCLRNNMLSVYGFEKDSSLIGCQCCSYCKNECLCESCVNI